jgi:hypothetical protein
MRQIYLGVAVAVAFTSGVQAQVLTEYWCGAGDMGFTLIFDENVPRHLFLEVSVSEMMDQSLNTAVWLEGGWAGVAYYFAGNGFEVSSTGDGFPVLRTDGASYQCEGVEG